jgi:signal transduction histidine kinase
MSRTLKILSRSQCPQPTGSEESAYRRISKKASLPEPDPDAGIVRQSRFNLNPPFGLSSTLRSQTEGRKTKCRLDENSGQESTRRERTRREEKKDRITLETINKLMLTISHYLNNPLTILLGKVELLTEATENGGMSKEDVKKFTDSCKREIRKIDSIIKVFQNLCEVRYKTYPPGIKMLDVEKELKHRLREVEVFNIIGPREGEKTKKSPVVF